MSFLKILFIGMAFSYSANFFKKSECIIASAGKSTNKITILCFDNLLDASCIIDVVYATGLDSKYFLSCQINF